MCICKAKKRSSMVQRSGSHAPERGLKESCIAGRVILSGPGEKAKVESRGGGKATELSSLIR